MRVVHSPSYHIDIGLHVFPTLKYQEVCTRLLESRIVLPAAVAEPEIASWDDLALVHSTDYLRKVRDGDLTAAELARLELPWSPAVVEGFRLVTGGTLVAARLALEDRVTLHVGGGFHHAFPDHGEGFCLFNDVAVAIRVLQRDGLIQRAAVLDCDVHHGNGTAWIFESDPSVFTCSLHQQDNYPQPKPPSGLDIGLANDTDDAEYLEHLQEALEVVSAADADLLVYLAGADPFEDDQLGGLALTQDGLRRRDRVVLRSCAAAGLPVAIVLAGGYARQLEDTVSIHVATAEEAVRALEAPAEARRDPHQIN